MKTSEEKFREAYSKYEEAFPGFIEKGIDAIKNMTASEYHEMLDLMEKDYIKLRSLTIKKHVEFSMMLFIVMFNIYIPFSILIFTFSVISLIFISLKTIKTWDDLTMVRGSINDFKNEIDLYKSLH